MVTLVTNAVVVVLCRWSWVQLAPVRFVASATTVGGKVTVPASVAASLSPRASNSTTNTRTDPTPVSSNHGHSLITSKLLLVNCRVC